VLLSRNTWARAFLREIDVGHFAAKDVASEHLRVVALHRDRSLKKMIQRLAPDPGGFDERSGVGATYPARQGRPSKREITK
jgi:hypothetical protein